MRADMQYPITKYIQHMTPTRKYISFTANNKSVQVKEDGGKWHINVDNGGWYPVKDMKDLLIQIDVRTQDGKPELPNSSMQQVMTCSRAILDMRRGGF